jgi:tripartite-type tricarboxylate transporter receptor subunit TctC
LSNSDFELEVATVLAAPKGTPPAVLEKLNAALNEALKDPAVLKSFSNVGATPYPTSLQGAAQELAALQAKMKPLIDSGLLTSQKVD